jgi:hypothetical protein
MSIFIGINWQDMEALGLSPNSEILFDNGSVAVKNGGGWLINSVLSLASKNPPPSDETEYMRHVRGLVLTATDWTQANDAPLSGAVKSAWAVYRQALRDLPDVVVSGQPIPWPEIPQPDENSIPPSVSARQIRLWLVAHGISMTNIEAAIDSIADQATRDSVKIEWEYAPYIERTHSWLIPMATALGLTEAQVDQAFREASVL